jgi:uncharacterized membrane protein YiaA
MFSLDWVVAQFMYMLGFFVGSLKLKQRGYEICVLVSLAYCRQSGLKLDYVHQNSFLVLVLCKLLI